MTQKAITPTLVGFTLVLGLMLCHSSAAFAHGEAVLCDHQRDLVEQCGEVHECVTDPEVSEVIGYCKADTEDISFTLCDRSAEESPCASGEVCKIGTIDPQIGVCAEVVTEMDSGNSDEEDHSGHDHGDHDHGDHDHSEGCQSSSSSSPTTPIALLIMIISGGIIRSRRSSL